MSAFAQATGLRPDTIRFYVRRGLLDPQSSAKGGRNPYQLFTAEHVRVAEYIRMGQALGLSLREIGVLLADARSGRLDRERRLAMMSSQRDRLRRRAAELEAMAAYLDAKIAWEQAGGVGEQPSFPNVVPAPS